jgi:hypothetical protein
MSILFWGFFHLVDVSDVADLSGVHAASIFRIEVCKMGEFVYIKDTVSENNVGEQGEWG